MIDFAQTTLVNAGNNDRSFIVGSSELSPPIPEPVVQQSYAVSVTSGNEGGDVIVTVNTTGVSNNTLMYLTIATNSSVALGDFYDSTWNVNIYNNVGKLKLHVKKDKLIEGTENIILQLRIGSSKGTIVATSNSASILDTVIAAVPAMPVAPPITPMPINPTIPSLGTPSYTITASPSTLKENTANILNINTINVLDGTPLFITVGGLGTATVNDFIGYPLRTTVANGKASRSVYSIVDAIVETETVQFELRTGNPNGPIVATTGNVVVLESGGTGGHPVESNETYFLYTSPSVITEGAPLTLSLATSGVANGTILYLTSVNEANSFDFSTEFGTLTVQNGVASKTLTSISDTISEGAETIQFQLRKTSYTGSVVATSASISLKDVGNNDPTYVAFASPNTIGEGSSIVINVTTSNVVTGTTLFATIDPISTAGYSDLLGGPWSISVSSNQGTAIIVVNQDSLLESTESVAFQIRLGSPVGPVVATSNTILIDPALSVSTYSFGSLPSSINEGQSFTITVTTTNVVDGTQLFITKSDAATISNADFATLPRSITINGGTGSTSLSLSADVTTEGTETAQFVLRAGSSTGTVVATSTQITISDTSKPTDPPVEEFSSLLTTKLAGKSPIGVYYESWGDFTLANINSPVNVVNIAHVRPNCSYVAGSNSFVGSNLGFFSNTFAEVKAAIATLKSRGILVLLSIGDLSSNPFSLGTYNPTSIISLCDDLGCDGVDLDWESPIDSTIFGPLIQATRNAAGSTRIVTAAVTSTGAYGTGAFINATPLGSAYSGVNRPGLVSHGELLDGINIMAYDSSTALSTTQCIDSYADCYAGPLIVGFEVPPEGWGDHVVTLPEVTSVVTYIRGLSNQNGFYVWSYKKIGTPTAQQIIDTGAGVLPPVAVPYVGMFWQTLNDNVALRRDWQRLGITKTAFQWVAVDGQSFIPQSILPLHFGQLNLADISTYPWASEIILGLAGEFSEATARTNVSALATLAEQFGALTYPSNVRGFYFPIELDPTWADFATVMAPLWSKLPKPIYISLYYGPGYTSTSTYATYLASVLPPYVNVMFQDGVGAHGYTTSQALTRFNELKSALGANRVSLIAEAFRINPSGTPAFISATASQLQTQLTAYDGLPIWLFDGPTYLTTQLINDIAGTLPELLAPTGLTAVRSSGDDIKLTWSRNTGSTHQQNQTKIFIYSNDGNNTLLRTLTVNGTATTAYYLAEEAIADFGFPASFLTWAVREYDTVAPITGALSTISSGNVSLDNTFVTHAVVFAGQSNSAGHFYGPLSTLNGKTSSAVFRSNLATGLGIPPATLTVVNAAVGNTAAEFDADATSGDQYHWWNLTTNQPGPTMLEFETKVAGVIGKNIVGIVWAQGETDVGGGALIPATSTVARFTNALTAIFNRMRSVLGSVTIPIWFQPLGRSYWPLGGVLLDANGQFFKEYRDAQITLAASDPYIRIGAWLQNGGQSAYVLESGALLHYTAAMYHDLAAQLATSMSTQADRIASPPVWTTLQTIKGMSFTFDGSNNIIGTWTPRVGVSSYKVYSFRVDNSAPISQTTVNTPGFSFTAAEQTAVYGFAGVSILVYVAEVVGSNEGPPTRFFGTPTTGGGGGTPTYSISVSPSSVTEGGTITGTVTTTNVVDNTHFYITVGGSGTAVHADFTGMPTDVYIMNNTASFTASIASDSTSEGSESAQFELRTNNFGGTVVATSNVVTLVDQSSGGGSGGTAVGGIDSVAIHSNPYSSAFPTGMSFTVTYQAMYDTGSMLTDYEILSEDGATVYRAGTVAVNNTLHTSTFYWSQAEQIADRGYSTSYYRCRIRRRSTDSLITAEWSSFIGNISV